MSRREPLPRSSKLVDHSSSDDDDEDGGCPLPLSSDEDDDTADDDDDDDDNNNNEDNSPVGAPLKPQPRPRPRPRPRDLYSHGKAILERIEQLRAIYKTMLELEASMASNLVQEVRGELNIEWMRRDEHEEALDDDRNLQTIRELRHLLALRDGEIDLLKQQLEMVDEMTQKRPARLSFDNGDNGDGDGQGHGQRVRLAGYGQNREKSAPGAKTLLSKEFKSWR